MCPALGHAGMRRSRSDRGMTRIAARRHGRAELMHHAAIGCEVPSSRVPMQQDLASKKRTSSQPYRLIRFLTRQRGQPVAICDAGPELQPIPCQPGSRPGQPATQLSPGSSLSPWGLPGGGLAYRMRAGVNPGAHSCPEVIRSRSHPVLDHPTFQACVLATRLYHAHAAESVALCCCCACAGTSSRALCSLWPRCRVRSVQELVPECLHLNVSALMAALQNAAAYQQGWPVCSAATQQGVASR